ncbi:hypothetical protein MRX96_039455 [Rhipicephalus microplus]
MARGKRRTSREFREPKVPEKGSVSNGVAQQDEIWNECTPLFEPHRPTTLFWLKEKGHTKKYRSVDKGPPVLPIRRSPLRGETAASEVALASPFRSGPARGRGKRKDRGEGARRQKKTCHLSTPDPFARLRRSTPRHSVRTPPFDAPLLQPAASVAVERPQYPRAIPAFLFVPFHVSRCSMCVCVF